MTRERIRQEFVSGHFWPVLLDWKSRRWRGHKSISLTDPTIYALAANEAVLYDTEQLPAVFEAVDEHQFSDVDKAIEDRPSMYDEELSPEEENESSDF